MRGGAPSGASLPIPGGRLGLEPRRLERAGEKGTLTAVRKISRNSTAPMWLPLTFEQDPIFPTSPSTPVCHLEVYGSQSASRHRRSRLTHHAAAPADAAPLTIPHIRYKFWSIWRGRGEQNGTCDENRLPPRRDLTNSSQKFLLRRANVNHQAAILAAGFVRSAFPKGVRGQHVRTDIDLAGRRRDQQPLRHYSAGRREPQHHALRLIKKRVRPQRPSRAEPEPSHFYGKLEKTAGSSNCPRTLEPEPLRAGKQSSHLLTGPWWR